MKRIPLMMTAVFTLTVLLFACKEEVPDVKPGPVDDKPTDTSQISRNLLAKTVLTTGADVTTMICQYDAQNRLTWMSNTSTEKDYVEDTSKIYRDADGHIAKVVTWSDSYIDPKVDSVVSTVFYNAATSAYSHRILKYKYYGYDIKDSFAYTYDAQSRIVKAESFYFDAASKSYLLFGTSNLTYDAKGDAVNYKVIYYNINGTKNSYPYELTFMYDDKASLLNLGNEAVVLGLERNWSGHNPVKMIGSYPVDPQYNQSLTYVYKYNTKDRPLSAEVTNAVTGVKSNLVFTYQ